MQKAFAWIEGVLVCAVLLGSVLRLALIKGGATIIIISAFFLSMLYFAAGYFQPTPSGQKATAALVKIVSGLALSILVIGVVFKFMFWNGASAMLVVGLFTTLVLSVMARVLTHPAQDLPGVFRRGVTWSVVGTLFFFVNSSTLFGLINRNDPVLVEKFNARAAHPADSQYQAEYDAYVRQHYSPPARQ